MVKNIVLLNITLNKLIAHEVKVADNFFARLKGLLGLPSLPHGQALVLSPCNSVHTCFMKFAIDVLFLDSDYRVIHMVEAMKPWKFSPIIKNAAKVVEMPAGSLSRAGINTGDILELKETSWRCR